MLETNGLLYSALAGLAYARPASAFWRHQPVADQNTETFVNATLRFHEAVGGDLVKLTPAGTYQATALGLEDAWQGDALGRRAVIGRRVKVAGDWSKLLQTDLGHMEEVNVAACWRLRQRLPDGVPLLATVFGPLTQALQLAGVETLLQHWQAAPEALLEGVTLLQSRTVYLIDCLRQAGADGIYYVSQHHIDGLMPSAMALQCGWSADMAIMQHCAGFSANILHLHGVPLLRDIPALPDEWTVHYEWTRENPQPHELTQAVRRLFAIGLPTAVLSGENNVGQRQQLIQNALLQFGQTNALVTAGCVLPLDFPLSLARRWVEAVETWQE